MLEVSDANHEFFSHRRMVFDEWVRAFAAELNKLLQQAMDERYEDEIPSEHRPEQFAELKAYEMQRAKEFAARVRRHHVDDTGHYVPAVTPQERWEDGHWIDMDPLRIEALSFSNARFQVCENLRFYEEAEHGKLSVRRQISSEHPPCTTCAGLIRKKWMPMQEMPLIGQCQCGHGCTCYFFCSAKVMYSPDEYPSAGQLPVAMEAPAEPAPPATAPPELASAPG